MPLNEIPEEDSTPSFDGKKDGLLKQLGLVARNALFVQTTLALSSIALATSGIQFVWVRLFTEGWEVSKPVAVASLLTTMGIGGSLGVAIGPCALDRCAGFDTAEGRRKATLFMAAMMGAAAGSAVVGLYSLRMRFEQLETHDDAMLASDFYASMFTVCIFIMWFFFNTSIAGLCALNVNSLDTKLWSFGSGVATCAQNLFGNAVGPLLPGMVIDNMALDRSDPFNNAEGFVYGTAAVLVGTIMTFVFTAGAYFAASAALVAEQERKLASRTANLDTRLLRPKSADIDGSVDRFSGM
jgi:hypothetical protein